MSRYRPHAIPTRTEMQSQMQPQKQTPEVFTRPARRIYDDKSSLMPIEQVNDNQAVDARANVPSQTQNGTSRFFCGQKIKFTDKREKNTSLNRRVRVGSLDPDAISKKSPAGSFFENQDIIYDDESKENIDNCPEIDLGTMRPNAPAPPPPRNRYYY
ncbi:hypothetical protein NE237_011295 [Protea cynaroides]|uniref:Uncharacterized protein n=1 Tax=Protea cynaroides TaxID=273540 RepID=A0A9Q0JWV5_9MAGN|nr:hypothetical protein NE237_011295 [Protea cynaroides]